MRARVSCAMRAAGAGGSGFPKRWGAEETGRAWQDRIWHRLDSTWRSAHS